MKCGREIIVGVFLKKLVVKVEIGAFWVATLTPTAGDALSSQRLNHMCKVGANNSRSPSDIGGGGVQLWFESL